MPANELTKFWLVIGTSALALFLTSRVRSRGVNTVSVGSAAGGSTRLGHAAAAAAAAANGLGVEDVNLVGFKAELEREEQAAVVGITVKPTTEPPAFSAPSPDATPPPAFSAPSPDATPPPAFSAPSPDAAPLPANAAPSPPSPPPKSHGSTSDGTNPYIAAISAAQRKYWEDLKPQFAASKAEALKKYGSFCDKTTGAIVTGCWTITGYKEGVSESQIERATRANELSSLQVYSKTDSCKCNATTAYSNSTNWQVAREQFCTKINAEHDKKFPLPPDIRKVLHLNFDDGIDEGGSVKSKFAPAFPSGPRSGHGELPYSPETVKGHFQALRAGLSIYYRGQEGWLADKISPQPADPEYGTVKAALVKRFAAALVHGGDLVAGVLGDSTTAGADNCIYDAWPYGLERQLVPLFAAAKVNFKMRNAGHNGGLSLVPQLACARGILGEGVDFMLYSAPYVKPGPYPILAFVRRALASGAIPFVATPDPQLTAELEQYRGFGVAAGDGFDSKTVGPEWWPSKVNIPGDRASTKMADWGQVDTGLCHRHVRTGSLAVTRRNWHPGPAGHELNQDMIAYWWADAIIDALDAIAAELAKSGGKLGPLKARWPRRSAVPAAELPAVGSELCDGTAIGRDRRRSDYDESASRYACAAGKFPSCIAPFTPKWGPDWQDWMAPSKANPADPSWDTKGNGIPWAVQRVGSQYPDKWWKDTTRWQEATFPLTGCRGHCYGVQAHPLMFELNRSVDDCHGVDYFDGLAVSQPGGWATFRIPANSMVLGSISLCAACAQGRPDVKIKGVDIDASQSDPSFVWGFDSRGAGEDEHKSKPGRYSSQCGTVTATLPAAALKAEVMLGVHCSEGKLLYLSAE